MDKALAIKRDIVQKGEVPVDIVKLAEDNGLKVVYFNPAQMKGDDFENVSGLLDKANKKIYVNSTDSPERRQFTIAHELGHYVYDHAEGKFGLNYRNTTVDLNSAERQANEFAGEVLVPSPILRKKLKKYALAKPTMVEFARLFGVSVDVMRIRVERLGLGSFIQG